MGQEWLSLVLGVGLALALLLLPGAVVLKVSGHRGVAVALLAPPASSGLIGVSIVVTSRVGGVWSAFIVLGATFALSLVTGVLHRRRGTHRDSDFDIGSLAARWHSRTGWAVLCAIVLALVLWLRHFSVILGRADALSQTWDNIFHLSVIRFIASSGSPGPRLPTGLLESSITAFHYPTTWHALVALVLPATGDDILIASNALLIATCGVVWPSSVLALAIALGVRSVPGLLSTAILSASFGAFPFALLSWGAVFPNLLGYACLPALLAVIGGAVSQGSRVGLSLASCILWSVAAVGLAIAHPNALVLLLMLLLPPTVAGVITTVRGAPRYRRAPWLVLSALSACAAIAAWGLLRPNAPTWPPIMDVGSSLAQAALANTLGGPPLWVPAVLTLIGLEAVARRRGTRWFLGSVVIAVVLWVAAAAMPYGQARDLFVGTWYGDPYRLAAPLAILAVPVAGLGAEASSVWFSARIGSWAEADHVIACRVRVAGSLVIVTGILGLTQWSSGTGFAVLRAAATYDLAELRCPPGDRSCLVTEDELVVLRAIPELVPQDAVLLAEPSNGASLVFALSGRRVLRPYIGITPSAAEEVLLDDLATPGPPTVVCQALIDTGVTYVLDFGVQAIDSEDVSHPFHGSLESSDALVPILVKGNAALYAVTGC